ncbi:N-6 DNA methylase [Streptomyces sp. NPDC093085]|uniref:N-6 DNA methylase n=1 Tax=Streptomyces sp. NPDC093085 TaxID=3155068 RepID=UPI003442E334
MTTLTTLTALTALKEGIHRMESREMESHTAEVVDRLWRAYAPYQRGRNTFGDPTSMLAILLLARFVDSVSGAGSEVGSGVEGEFVKRWNRAVAESRLGLSPLKDLRAAMAGASRHRHFPVFDFRDLDVGVFDGDEDSGDVPWAAAFLTALHQRRPLDQAGWAELCELLLERHVQEGTYSAGEFYTPRAVADLLVESVSPQPGDRILDPACGSGGLLAVAAQRIAGAGPVDGAAVEAYATDRSNPRLAMMNLALHGVDQPVVGASDPVSLFRRQGDGLADRVVCNPPFNQRVGDVDSVDWPFGQPPASNANFAWLQLAWSRLSENGTAAMLMPQGAAWAEGRQEEIRKEMIAGGALLAVIALPERLFHGTSVHVHLWILARDTARQLPPGDADKVLFIDAGRLGAQVPRQRLVLTADDTERISRRLHAWQRSPRTTPDEPGFSRSVAHEEILANDGSLDPRLYVEVEREQTDVALDLSPVSGELDPYDDATSRSRADLRMSLGRCERLARGGARPPRVLLGDIVRALAEEEKEREEGEGREGREGGAVVFGASPSAVLLAGPSGSLIRAKDYVADEGAGVPVVMPKDLTDSGFTTTSIRFISERHAQSLRRFRLLRGDVVLARRGELGRCAVVREEQEGWVCGTGCFLLRPPAGLDAGYLAAYLRGPEARRWLDAHSTGSRTMKTISLKVLEKLPVVLPDLGRQRAIASAMGRLDEHERLLREELAVTRKMRGDALNGILVG